MENSDTNHPTQPQNGQPSSDPVKEDVRLLEILLKRSRQNRFLKLLLETETIIALVIIAVILVILFSMYRLLNRPAPFTPSPVPSADSASASALPARDISEFGKTDDFKRYEEKLQALDKDAAMVDLSESELAFPLLDMNVNFSNKK